MRTLVSSLLFTSVSALTAAPAFADDTSVSFITLDGAADGSRVTADLALSTFDEATFARTSVFGQYVGATGFGGYAGIDAAMAFADDSDDSYESLGNLQVGGLLRRTVSPDLDIGLRAGLVLPTSSSEGFDGFAHVLATGIARPTDVVTAYPDATWLRVAASPTFHRGGFFARADLGVDIAVLDTDRIGFDAVGHANVGIGARTGNLSATAELQNVFVLGEDDSDFEDDMSLSERFIHTAGVSLRYHAASVEPFIAVSSPLDDDLRGDVVTVTAGIAAPL
jgi:hypothetical protein